MWIGVADDLPPALVAAVDGLEAALAGAGGGRVREIWQSVVDPFDMGGRVQTAAPLAKPLGRLDRDDAPAMVGQPSGVAAGSRPDVEG